MSDSSTADDSVLAALAATPQVAGGGAVAEALAPGTLIDGQFRIAKKIGAGGMGAVFLARDVRLDRDVALKLGNVVSASALRRIEREAVALAKLSHPNVVVVHQVGKHDDRLYIAMEYVKGGNAREWLAAAPRTWREIVALYASAADGLAAAHAAGFVHRDFKPDNVLVGDDGRPRVADFGLVRAANESVDPDEPHAALASPALAPMTQTGAVLGTPAYMAPEQFAGEPTDTRTDQFALCASIWEALFGTRPFPGNTPEEIARSVEREELAEPSRRVPRHVVAALRRGLRRDRDQRWPSLAPLIGELRYDPARRRRNVLVAAALVATTATAIAVPLATGKQDPCADGAAEIARSWNPVRAGVVAAAFDSARLKTSWSSVSPAIDRYARAWADGHRAACRATRVAGSQSEAILDQRMLCLRRARARLDATIDAFVASRDAAANASAALDRLLDLGACADVTAIAQQRPLPRDPAVRAQIEEAAKLVDGAEGATVRGWERELGTRANEALAAARATQWPPLIAQALRVHATSLADHKARLAELRDAASAAIAAGDDRTAAWALADGSWEVAYTPKLADADTWLALARGLWTRLGEPADIGNRIEGADAERLIAIGDPTAALAAMRRSVELGAKAYPNNAFDRADFHYNLARALVAVGNYDEAQREIDEAVALATQLVGDAHPMLAGYVQLSAGLAQQRGRIDDAVALDRRALAIDEGWYGPHDPRIGATLRNLAEMLALRGDVDEARPLLERALALDPDDENDTAGNLALLEARSGHFARAIEVGERSLARADQRTGERGSEMSSLLIVVGISHRELGHLGDSARFLQQAIDVDTAALGADHANTVNAQIELSYTLVAQHHAGDAAQLLAPALALTSLPPQVAAELHAAYGKAVWETGDHVRARREVDTGRAGYAALGDAFASETAGAEAWLRTHR